MELPVSGEQDIFHELSGYDIFSYGTRGDNDFTINIVHVKSIADFKQCIQNADEEAHSQLSNGR